MKLLRGNLTDKEIKEINTESLKVNFYSMSFCERNDNEYLWDNYTENQTGFCIEIDYDYF